MLRLSIPLTPLIERRFYQEQVSREASLFGCLHLTHRMGCADRGTNDGFDVLFGSAGWACTVVRYVFVRATNLPLKLG